MPKEPSEHDELSPAPPPPRVPPEPVSASPLEALDPDEPDEQGASSRPFIALAFLLVLAVGGWFLINRLMAADKVQDCVMSGRRNCAPIDTSTAP